MKNKRSYRREQVTNVTVDISDNHFVFQDCAVEDVSINGIKVTGISPKFDHKSQKITCVVTIDGEMFKLRLRPSWMTASLSEKILGFKVKGINIEWADKILEIMSETDKQDGDVWKFVR